MHRGKAANFDTPPPKLNIVPSLIPFFVTITVDGKNTSKQITFCFGAIYDEKIDTFNFC